MADGDGGTLRWCVGLVFLVDNVAIDLERIIASHAVAIQ